MSQPEERLIVSQRKKCVKGLPVVAFCNTEKVAISAICTQCGEECPTGYVVPVTTRLSWVVCEGCYN